MTASSTTVLEDVLRRERLVLVSSLVAVVGLAWHGYCSAPAPG